MNTKLVNHVADVICRAMENGRHTPAGWAMALESAQLLQSPETAAELDRLRKYAESQQSREEELLATLGQYNLVDHPDAWGLGMAVISHLEGPHRPSTNEELEPGLRKLIEQLRTRVSELEQQLAAKDRPADEFPIRYALTDKATATVPAPQSDASPRRERLRDLLAVERAMVLEDPHDSPLHHDYRVPRDLPEVQ